jgi:hypothetical protein
MTPSTTIAKLAKSLSEILLSDPKTQELLFKGDLMGFENKGLNLVKCVFNAACEIVLPQMSEKVCEKVKAEYKNKGLKKLVWRPFKIELSTGYEVIVPSLYAKIIPDSSIEERHILAHHWSIVANASPLRVSQVSMCGALAPSYDIANELLKVMGVNRSSTRTRNIMTAFAKFCFDKEVDLCLGEKETLAGKRVVVAADGGRTRTKKYKTKEGKKAARKAAKKVANEAKNLRCTSYDTPWCEPKLFVIQVLDEDGKMSKMDLPIYGTRFGDVDMLTLLKAYLRRLKIDEAQEVQIIADGAPWIWNTMQPLLLELGVAPERIVETLDYFHAVSYVNSLVGSMSKKVSKTEKASLISQFKTLLWEGKSAEIVKVCREKITAPTQEQNRWINYLEKHTNRTQYAEYEKGKWLCGSGIVESGIRRVINLRFKGPSSFWCPENVEKLFMLRSTCLAKRWGILMDNFCKLAFI